MTVLNSSGISLDCITYHCVIHLDCNRTCTHTTPFRFPQNAIDLDQMYLELGLAEETSSGFVQAKEIYLNGGNSKSIARVRLLPNSVLTQDIPERTDFIGEAEDGDEINFELLKDAERGTDQLFLRYKTSEVQEFFNQCRVGGLKYGQTVMMGCKCREDDVWI